MRRLFALLALIFIVSCSTNDVPNNILSPDEMKPILWQQIKADVFTKENLSIDSVKKNNLFYENEKLQMQIFKNLGVSKSAFYKSYNYYLTHEEKFAALIDSMIAQQNRENLEYIKNNYNDNLILNRKNIFMEYWLKKRPVFTLTPDTLTEENSKPIKILKSRVNE